MAESIFRELVTSKGLQAQFEIDSAGTAGYHVGENPDERTIRVLVDNGIYHFSKARKVKATDLGYYDQILAMDLENQSDLSLLAQNESERDKIQLFRNFDPVQSMKQEVPDPYYGTMRNFVEVFEMLHRTSTAFLEKISKV
ncbi:low molecular weight phosphotyrosine protein phosphatase [bacterium]|nr:low molecular weight phosphotyrosine protein phosphatase [bacterium]